MEREHGSSKSIKTLHSFFKKIETDPTKSSVSIDSPIADETHYSKSQRSEHGRNDTTFLQRDPSLRCPIWSYHVNEQDEVRRKYINMGPYQPKLDLYPLTSYGKQQRRFQYSWFIKFPWLEYSLENDKVFCFPCFLFESNPPKHPTFTIKGYGDWKRINDKSRCGLLTHEGKPNSSHNGAMQQWYALKNPSTHVDKMICRKSSEQVMQNRLQLKASIETFKWLAKQACAFRGHGESSTSSNCGNFIEMVKLFGIIDEDIANFTLNCAPSNAKYISPTIEKEVLNIIANNIRKKIRQEVGNAKFSILVDEAVDESTKEQMTIILRFVDCDGFIRERVFDMIHVQEATALNLKEKICLAFSKYNFQIKDIRGQGYDGAGNMRGTWNELQALFMEDSPCAHYVHCFAHRLQLSLVAASKDVHDVWEFFSKLSFVVNFVGALAKRCSELKCARDLELVELLDCGELEIGSGVNQICILQRPEVTRWSSHFASVNRLIEMFGATCTVLDSIAKDGRNYNIRGEAKVAFKAIRCFDFVFILLLMNKIMEITDFLCQALQFESQDVLNVTRLVKSTKEFLEKLRSCGWNDFLQLVLSFCEKHDINTPVMSDIYLDDTRRTSFEKNHLTVNHHYQFDIFNAVIDFQLQEISERFSNNAMELLNLSSTLNPVHRFKSFNIDHICNLASKFYSEDFTQKELEDLRRQLMHYEIDVVKDSKFQEITSFSILLQELVKDGRSNIYFLIDRLIRLILTLPVFTATTERAFSTIKLIKTFLRNNMEEEFLADCMVLYIEMEFVETIDSDWVIDEFYALKHRRALFR